MKFSAKMIPVLGLASLLFGGSALAKPFSYTYAEGGIADVEDDGDQDADLMFLGGSYALDHTQRIIVRASVSKLDYDRDVEFDAISVGVGHPISISLRSDVLFALDYSFAESESDIRALDNVDADSLTASATSRTWLTNNIEGNLIASLIHQEVGNDNDSGVELGAGLRVYVIPPVSIAATISRSFIGDMDRDSIGVSARLQF